MRIASGTTDQYVYFIAVDSTDYATRETGLSSFTVYRSRNGAAAAAMTTPTINEVDATNMPGVYELLLDEDMTIGVGNDTEEMVFHITHAGMAPVTRTIELYRPKYTVGSTLSLADINAECDTAISDASLATSAALATVDSNVDAILTDTGTTLPATLSTLATSSALATVDANVDAILVDTGTTLPGTLSTIDGKIDTVDANVDAVLTDTGTTLPAQITGLNNLSAADVRTAVGLASANLDTQLSTIDTVVDGIQTDLSNGTDGLGAIKTAVDAIPTSNPTAAAIADAVWDESLAAHTSAGSTGEALDGATAPSAADVADAVWDEAIAGHLTAGSTGASLNAAGSAGDPWATTLPGSYTGSQAGKILDDILTDTGTSIPSSISGLNDLSQADVRTAVGLASANLDTQLSTIDTNVDAILVDTGTTIPGTLASLNDLDAAGVRTAVGLSSANLDTQLAALPTATENADALLNRDMDAVSDTNSRTPLNALRFLRNKWSVSGTTLTVTKEDDTTSAWTATLTADASADPVTGSDPA